VVAEHLAPLGVRPPASSRDFRWPRTAPARAAAGN